MNLKLKRGLITQSLSPVFVLLVIRHFHSEYFALISHFFIAFKEEPCSTIAKAWCHNLFGELIVFIVGIVWVVGSLLYIPAFAGTQNHGFHNRCTTDELTWISSDPAILSIEKTEGSKPNSGYSFVTVSPHKIGQVKLTALLDGREIGCTNYCEMIIFSVCHVQALFLYSGGGKMTNAEVLQIADQRGILDIKEIVWEKHFMKNEKTVFYQIRNTLTTCPAEQALKVLKASSVPYAAPI